VLATSDTGFILVPAGALRPAVVCSGHCIASHRGAHRGGLQAWWERRPGLQVPEVLIEASANIVEKVKNGVNPVALLGVVLRLHTTAGSSWSHFRPDLFSRSKILGLRPCRIMPLARSTWLLVCGCATAAQSTRMWNLSQNSRNFLPVN
jgi:hypothetical protein